MRKFAHTEHHSFARRIEADVGRRFPWSRVYAWAAYLPCQQNAASQEPSTYLSSILFVSHTFATFYTRRQHHLRRNLWHPMKGTQQTFRNHFGKYPSQTIAMVKLALVCMTGLLSKMSKKQNVCKIQSLASGTHSAIPQTSGRGIHRKHCLWTNTKETSHTQAKRLSLPPTHGTLETHGFKKNTTTSF